MSIKQIHPLLCVVPKPNLALCRATPFMPITPVYTLHTKDNSVRDPEKSDVIYIYIEGNGEWGSGGSTLQNIERNYPRARCPKRQTRVKCKVMKLILYYIK